MRDKLFLSDIFWDQVGFVEEKHSRGDKPSGLYLVRTAGITSAPLKDFLFTDLSSARNYMLEKGLYKYVYAVENFSPDPEPIELVIKRRFLSLNLKVSTAESCTAGLLSSVITSVPGSSGYFERGFVTYSVQSKVDLLGVPVDEISSYGAVSPQVAVSMAVGALGRSLADIALSITCTAGPSGEPPGVGYFGFAIRKDKFLELFPDYSNFDGENEIKSVIEEEFVVRSVKKELKGSRHFNRLVMVYSSLSFLSRFLLLAEMLRYDVGPTGQFLFGDGETDYRVRVYRNLEELMSSEF